ncbi:MAG TPA: beta-N-acetylglucosaminidase domain-containing protein [Caulobacteraceae bacterium]
MNIELGIIEGYYGEPWTWEARAETVAFLAARGYRFYHYAPKADEFLRKRWREEPPAATMQALARLSAHCRSHGVRFGVGLSPFEIYRAFDDEAKVALARKLAALDQLGLDDLAILFDDMRGDLPALAATQVEIVHWAAQRTAASRVIVCPTYYSDDPTLDRAYGDRPAGYLEELGAALDPAVEIFWTGEEVCSREYRPGHLARVAEQLRRKPFLWDNYPVNDGPNMSQVLHIRAFTGRPASMAGALSAHAVNPALQCVLSRIPALSLLESYRQGEAYEYGGAFLRAAGEVLGPDLAALVQRHIGLLQDVGLDRLGETAGRIRACYAGLDHPGAREIVAFLDGAYRFDPKGPGA